MERTNVTNCEPLFGNSSGQTVIQSLFSKLKSFCQKNQIF
uniref:Uncharacterized protein n=1 Tax=Rhizophora mucronata TaxID=61149 RepID=A0A2P2LWN6_RHIMU